MELLTLALIALIGAPFAWLMARGFARFPISRGLLERVGVAIILHHYYEPLFFQSDLRHSLRDERKIIGLDLNETGQLALLQEFHFKTGLILLPIEDPGSREFFYHNGSIESGDAEYLYNMIRHFKPRRIVEIGAGNSTLLARKAIAKNAEEAPSYTCDHVCVEPLEAPWLEKTGARVVRTRLEECPFELFEDLGQNDILFIYSSHVHPPAGRCRTRIPAHIGTFSTGSHRPRTRYLYSLRLPL